MLKMSGLVLIDDTKSELDELQEAFTSSGIPCLPILFEKNKPGVGIDHVDLENFEPRLIITDLNLRDGANSSASAFFAVIAQMLKFINPKKPYLLYFWSKHSEEAERVMELIYQRCINEDYMLPLGWGILNKHEFKGTQDSNELKDKVKGLLTENPIFNALYSWESRVASAAQATSSTLVELAKDQVGDDSTGFDFLNSQHENLDTIISVIANETLGRKNAQQAKDEAVDLGLMPVLQDHLQMISEPNGLWSTAITKIGDNTQLDVNTVASLNSFYHTSSIPNQAPKSAKGVIVKLNDALLSTLDSKHKFESKLGIRIEDLLHEEFLSKSKLGMNKNDARAFQEEARANTVLGFVELSADCDQAQKKVKLHRYILCALIPEKYADLALSHGTTMSPRETAHDGIYKVPNIFWQNQKYILKLSFRYQIGTKPSTNVNGLEYNNLWLGEPILRLREQILSDISFKCAQFSTRPGIISFH